MLAAACAPRPVVVITSPQPATLAVITWNMHAGIGDLARLVDDLTAGRLTGVPPTDYVLLLQEAIQGGQHDPAPLAAARSLSFTYAPVRQTRAGTSGNAIVSTLPFAATRTITLPRQRQMRSAIAATVDVARTRLFVVDVHFENRSSLWRGLLFSDAARGRQAQALLRELPAGPGIAGGDFNTWLGRNEPAWKVLAARFPDTPASRLEPTFRDRLVLDHLFMDMPDGWQVVSRVVRDTYGSDHHPVIALVSASSS